MGARPRSHGRRPGLYTEWTLEADGNLVQSKGPVGAKDARPFDLAALDAAALAESIRKARDSLDVEGNVEASVEITHRPYDDEPSVTVTMRNEFGESGYLVTDLAGRVSGTYPYDPA